MDKVAIITGAARGIGLATAKIFLQQNYKVVIVDRDRNEVNKLKLKNDKLLKYICDISDPKKNKSMIEDIYKWGKRIDILVNNAGVADFGKIETVKFKNWRKIMDTNLDGTFLTTQNVIKYLKKTKGNIINIASISGLRASTLRIAYGTSKAAIIQLTQQQAIELGAFGIRVNCVSPGFIKSEMTEKISDNFKQSMEDKIALGRFGMPADIAYVIAFLSSKLSDYITGETIHVNGGMYFS